MLQQETVTVCVKRCRPGNSLQTQCPVLGVGHVGSLCSAHTKNRLPEGMQLFSTNYIVYTNRLKTVSHSYC